MKDGKCDSCFSQWLNKQDMNKKLLTDKKSRESKKQN